MKIGKQILATEVSNRNIKRAGNVELVGQQLPAYTDPKGGYYVMWNSEIHELLYEAGDKLPAEKTVPEKQETPDEAKKLKIFKNGTWKEFELMDVRLVEQTGYSTVPQFAWEFQNVEDPGEKYTKWSKTTLPLDSIIGSYICSVMEEFKEQELLLDPKQFIGKKAKGLVADISFMKKGEQARTKKVTITRFAALYQIEKVKLQKFM